MASDEAPDGTWLVGFRMATGSDWGGVLRSLQPIYQNGEDYAVGRKFGAEGGVQQTEVLAKPGYAVSRVELQRGLVVNAIRVTFSRVVAEHFDPADAYQTPWLGNHDGRPVEQLSSRGGPLIGLTCAVSGECFEDIQLIRATVKREEG